MVRSTVARIVIKPHCIKMQLNFEHQRFDICICPSCDGDKLDSISGAGGLNTNKSHLNFQGEIPITSEQLFA
jgi:Zn finger protein HypA/HybF involved in hydrogenase expression